MPCRKIIRKNVWREVLQQFWRHADFSTVLWRSWSLLHTSQVGSSGKMRKYTVFVWETLLDLDFFDVFSRQQPLHFGRHALLTALPRTVTTNQESKATRHYAPTHRSVHASCCPKASSSAELHFSATATIGTWLSVGHHESIPAFDIGLHILDTVGHRDSSLRSVAQLLKCFCGFPVFFVLLRLANGCFSKSVDVPLRLVKTQKTSMRPFVHSTRLLHWTDVGLLTSRHEGAAALQFRATVHSREHP